MISIGVFFREWANLDSPNFDQDIQTQGHCFPLFNEMKRQSLKDPHGTISFWDSYKSYYLDHNLARGFGFMEWIDAYVIIFVKIWTAQKTTNLQNLLI